MNRQILLNIFFTIIITVFILSMFVRFKSNNTVIEVKKGINKPTIHKLK